MKKIMIMILSLIVLTMLYSSTLFATDMSPGVTVLSPNGKEIYAVGDTVTIKWSGIDSEDFYLGIFLADGPTPGFITSINPISASGEYKWKIQEYIIQGDVGLPLQLGKYKIELILYDGKPCMGFCPPPDQYPQPKIIAVDKSDDYFNIVSETNECVKEEGVCGGIMGLRCCDGLMCEITDKYQTDATGVCVKETPNKPPFIIGVSGPTNLEVNEMGKWKIEAYDPDGKYLKYNVDWGENVIYPGSEASEREINQEATFTHSYSQPGIYKVVFTVTDENDGKAQSSISVNVGGSYNEWEEFSLKEWENKGFEDYGIIMITWDRPPDTGENYDAGVDIFLSGTDAVPVYFMKIGNIINLPRNIGKLKLIDVWTIKTIPVQYVAKFGIKFDKNSVICSVCIDGNPTGKYDENGCMIYDCTTLTGCNAMVPYCPDGELIRTGINEAGCNIWKCVSKKQCNLEPEQGPCKARFVKFYFDKNEGTCKQFIWGGCEGVVPFDTLEECRDSCESELIEGKECPQLGYREKGQYCNINNGWENQRAGGEYCDNDFECSSNSCLDSQCTEPGFWTKLSEWLSKLFNLKV